MKDGPASLEQAKGKVLEALKEAWARDRLGERDFERLAKEAGAAATWDELLAAAAEFRARADRVAELMREVQAAAAREGGPSLEEARDALVEKLKELWIGGQLPDEEFERLAEAVGRASGADALLGVAGQLRAFVDAADDTLAKIRAALDFDEPWPRPRSRGDRPELLDEEALAALLAPGSRFASRPGYEDRAGQRRMLRLVARRFNEGGAGLIEAGTGTGKSLAYLLPAASWALKNRERTIVSTNTINLQQQIVSKDLPLAQEALGETVKWALVKGRGNYVSIRRAHLAAGSGGDLLADGDGTDLDAIMKWLGKTRDGSKTDLPAKPATAVWDEVKSDSDACLGDKCPHHQECFYFRARRGIADADVLVVNHALFFADLKVRIDKDDFENAAVLPRCSRVVFDEAHHVDEVATNAFTTELRRSGVLAVLSRLRSSRRVAGLLPSLAAALREQEGDPAARLLRLLAKDAPAAVESARARTNECFDALAAWTTAVAAKTGAGDRRAWLDDPIRLPAPLGGEPAADVATRTALDNLRATLSDVSRELDRICERIDEMCEEPAADQDVPAPAQEDAPAQKDAPAPRRRDLRADLQGRLLDLRSCRRRLSDARADLGRCLLPDEAGDADGDRVRWLATTRSRGNRRDVVVGSAPVTAGPILREHLFDRVRSAVLTSATMAVRRTGRPSAASGLRAPSFDHFRRWTGLEGMGRVHEALVDSPFDYDKQAMLAVLTSDAGVGRRPSGFARPGKWREMSGAEVAGVLRDLAEVTGGGVMALFTSYNALQGAAREFRSLAGARWEVFEQGTKSRDALIRDFGRVRDGVLLGTASFWEGVDVPGPSLRALLIHKLPFPVPSEPVPKARKEAMEARGVNGFLEYDVPVTGLRLKQGAGRLIRTRRDRGAVLLLDARAHTKQYGPTVLGALPPMPRRYGDWPSLKAALGQFYAAAPHADHPAGTAGAGREPASRAPGGAGRSRAAPKTAVRAYAPGSPIDHHVFGRGAVVERVPSGDGFKITVDFEDQDVGRKKLLLRGRAPRPADC